MDTIKLRQPKELTTWFSKTTKRSGWIKWSTPEKVCLCFSRTKRFETKTYDNLEEFHELYHSLATETKLRKNKV